MVFSFLGSFLGPRRSTSKKGPREQFESSADDASEGSAFEDGSTKEAPVAAFQSEVGVGGGKLSRHWSRLMRRGNASFTIGDTPRRRQPFRESFLTSKGSRKSGFWGPSRVARSETVETDLASQTSSCMHTALPSPSSCDPSQTTEVAPDLKVGRSRLRTARDRIRRLRFPKAATSNGAPPLSPRTQHRRNRDQARSIFKDGIDASVTLKRDAFHRNGREGTNECRLSSLSESSPSGGAVLGGVSSSPGKSPSRLAGARRETTGSPACLNGRSGIPSSVAGSSPSPSSSSSPSRLIQSSSVELLRRSTAPIASVPCRVAHSHGWSEAAPGVLSSAAVAGPVRHVVRQSSTAPSVGFPQHRAVVHAGRTDALPHPNHILPERSPSRESRSLDNVLGTQQVRRSSDTCDDFKRVVIHSAQRLPAGAHPPAHRAVVNGNYQPAIYSFRLSNGYEYSYNALSARLSAPVVSQPNLFDNAQRPVEVYRIGSLKGASGLSWEPSSGIDVVKRGSSLYRPSAAILKPRMQAQTDEGAPTILRAGQAFGFLPDELRVSPADIKFDKVMGSGGAADVWRGTWRGADVAVKVLHQNVSGAARLSLDQDFYSELQIMSKLRHPNLVLLMGASVAYVPMCIVTEFCSGGTLYQLLHDRRIKLSIEQKLKISLDIAKGCLFLHTATPKVIHRDLKSLNILLTTTISGPNDQVHAKITDFGLSRLTAPHRWETQEGGWRGTVSWMAPELFEHRPFDGSIDVYAFGVVLYEIFSGALPYSEIRPPLSVTALSHAVMKGLRPSLEVLQWPSERREQMAVEAMRSLMVRCWDASSHLRPSFHQIVDELRKVESLIP